MHILVRAALAVLVISSAPIIAQPTAATDSITKADFFRPGIAPVRAPAGYDLTIVYFVDYQCPSCRQYTPDVARVLAEDRKVRVIYRDTPIISDMSTTAARAAIAASFQGRHAAFHHALMMSKGQLSDAAIRAAADQAKVDWSRLQRDLKARGEAIDEQIGRNVELAVATGVMGTPAFIVGDRLSNGALDYAGLKAEIADARAAAGKPMSTPAPVPTPTPASAIAIAASEDDAAGNAVAAVPPKPLFVPSALRPAAAADPSPQAPAGDRSLPGFLVVLAILAATGGGWWLASRRLAD